MKCVFLVICVSCVVFTMVEGRKTFSSRSRSRSKPSSNKYKPPPPPPPPPPSAPKKTDTGNNQFLDAERKPSHNGGNHQSPPIGFDNVNRGANNKPIGFEGINNKPGSGIGFDGLNSGNKPSAPVLPGNTNYGQPNPHFGQPHSGQSYPGQQNPGSNFGQSYPGQQNPGSNFGQSYPGQQNPGSNFGQSYPNQQNFGNPNQQKFGQNYPANPNNYGQSGQPHSGYNQGYPPGFGNGYPNNYQQGFGGGYGGNSFGGGYGGNSFGGGYGGNSFGGGYGGNSFGGGHGGNSFGSHGGGMFGGGGLFGSNNGFNSYGGGYNNYGHRSRFGLGGLPLPIPIPIPIPFGGFGGYGSGYNSHRSHQTLNNVVQRASNDSNNATSVYIINNSTVLPCSRENYSYSSYNISITTCTVLNCTAVSLKTVKKTNGNLETNYGSITMCLDPTATITTNSSGSNLPRISDVTTFWKSICEHMNPPTGLNNSQAISANSTDGRNLTENTNTLKTQTNATLNEETKTTTEAQTETTTMLFKPNIAENVTNSNLTSPSNITEKPCVILNCSTVEFCMPKAVIHCDDSNGSSCNYSVSSYTTCIDLKMCNSQNSQIIDREIKLNTKNDIIAKDNVLTNQTFNENITVIAYIPPPPAALVAQNTTYVNGINQDSTTSGSSGAVIVSSTASPL